MERIKQYYIRNITFCRAVMVMTVLIICTQLLSLITIWADFYTDHIYTFIRDPISRIIEPLNIALGEILMYIGATVMVMSVVILILLIFFRKRKGYVAFSSGFIKSLIFLY